jgi:antitoxin ParD1/3/4
MDVPIGERWQPFVTAAVETGRYTSVGDVVTEGLYLLQERDAQLQALRDKIELSIARGGSHTAEEAAAAVKARLDSMLSDEKNA